MVKKDEDIKVVVGRDENIQYYYYVRQCEENGFVYQICCGYGQVEYVEENYNYFNFSVSYSQIIF